MAKLLWMEQRVTLAQKQWMNDNKIDYIPSGGSPVNAPNGYPPNSPNMNPIENVFGYWQSQISGKNPQNIEQLMSICK